MDCLQVTVSLCRLAVCLNIWPCMVVQRLDSAIHWINLYPVESAISFSNTYPLDSDLSGG